MKPGLTAFVLFKNGEDILRRFFESVRPWADEIVAVDTGATDGCRAIAESFGARLYDLEFPGAFDAAYNFCIEKVKTEWTLYLDSDEWLPEESGPLLRDAIDRDDAFAYRLIRRDLDDKGGFTEMRMLRLWRTHPEMRLVGVIHSQFPDEVLAKAKGERKILDSEVRFLHDGFAGPPQVEKIKRNIELIEKELELRPGQPYFEANLAIEYLNLGDPKGDELAQSILDEALANPTREPRCLDISFLVSDALRRCPVEHFRSKRIGQIIAYGWKWFSGMPYVMWGIATAEERRGNHADSYRALRILERMADTGEYVKFSSFNPEVFGLPMRMLLTLAAIRAKDASTALRNVKKVLEINPEQPMAKQLYAQFVERGIR